MNHSTYHRGQVVTIGHQVGLKDAPITDYMFYLLKVKPASAGKLTATAGRSRQSSGSYAHKSLLAVNFFSKVAS
ncbi:DinB family protein [Paraflavitalea speifideaquila]|uniref:DinB family protein n=1 Tax=Paraflavitalea speifideaquila TaxID=3076558 RepID=UPI0028EC3A7D|nr:DinB family protein [Paraflavitalea speifideiaquila]